MAQIVRNTTLSKNDFREGVYVCPVAAICNHFICLHSSPWIHPYIGYVSVTENESWNGIETAVELHRCSENSCLLCVMKIIDKTIDVGTGYLIRVLISRFWRGIPSSRMWRRMAHVRTDILEERIASIIKVEKLCELWTALAVTSNLHQMQNSTIVGPFSCVPVFYLRNVGDPIFSVHVFIFIVTEHNVLLLWIGSPDRPPDQQESVTDLCGLWISKVPTNRTQL
jgi:hypothetical protein